MNRTALRPLRTRRIAATAPAASLPVAPLPAKSAVAQLVTRRKLALAGLAFLFGGIAAPAADVAAQIGDPTSGGREALIRRGSYLVESVGLCADCHTPRTDKGAFDRSKWLLGAALPFSPIVPMPWAPAAPPIAGLPSMTEAQGVAFLQTGKRPDGSMPRPPMPEFRLNQDDASAIAAYLKSLGK